MPSGPQSEISGLDYFFLKLPKDELSKAKDQIRSDYVDLLGPSPNVFDLTQYPLTRPRSLLTGGCFPTITKGCRLFSSDHHRLLHGYEALAAQGWPLHPDMHGYSRSLTQHFSGLSSALSTSFAGNGMHLACVGLSLSWVLAHGAGTDFHVLKGGPISSSQRSEDAMDEPDCVGPCDQQLGKHDPDYYPDTSDNESLDATGVNSGLSHAASELGFEDRSGANLEATFASRFVCRLRCAFFLDQSVFFRASNAKGDHGAFDRRDIFPLPLLDSTFLLSVPMLNTNADSVSRSVAIDYANLTIYGLNVLNCHRKPVGP